MDIEHFETIQINVLPNRVTALLFGNYSNISFNSDPMDIYF